MAKQHNIWAEEKVHATHDGRKPVCGVSGNATRKMKRCAGWSEWTGVTCGRCLRLKKN